MPITTTNGGEAISELTRAHGGEKDWPRARLVAAGLNAARRNKAKRRAVPVERLSRAARK